jgi:hypothetical protein
LNSGEFDCWQADAVWPDWPVINLNMRQCRSGQPAATTARIKEKVKKEKTKRASCLYANMCSTRSHYSQQKETAAEKQKGPTNRPTNNGTPEKNKPRKTRNSGARKRNQKNKTDKHTQTRQPAAASQRIITSLSLSNAIGISPESPRRCCRLLPIGPIGDTHMHPLHVRQGAAAAVGLFF